jgi:hypothetical protein
MTDCKSKMAGEAVAKALIFGDDIPLPIAADPSAASNPDGDEHETTEQFRSRLIYFLGQMMFVSGETAEPSPETTWMIEEIVREQVVEMVSRSCSEAPSLLHC